MPRDGYTGLTIRKDTADVLDTVIDQTEEFDSKSGFLRKALFGYVDRNRDVLDIDSDEIDALEKRL